MVARLGLGKYADAMKAAEAAIVIYLKLSDKYGQALCFTSIARAHVSNNQFTKALKAGGKALEVCRELGAPHWEASALDACVEALIKSNAMDEAVRQAKQGLAYIQRKAPKRAIARAMETVIRAYVARSNYKEALGVAKDALKTYAEAGDSDREAAMMIEISRLHTNMGDLDDAEQAANDSLTMYKKLHDAHGQNLATDMLGAAEDAKHVVETEDERVETIKEKIADLRRAIENRDETAFKAGMEAVFSDGKVTEADIDKLLEPLMKGDPEGTMEFLRENVEPEATSASGLNRLCEDGAVDDSKRFAYGIQIDRRMAYFFFRVGMMGYGPGFRLLKCLVGMDDKTGRPSGRFGISTLTYKDDMDEWEMTTGYHPGLFDCVLQTGAARNTQWDTMRTAIAQVRPGNHPHVPDRNQGLYTVA